MVKNLSKFLIFAFLFFIGSVSGWIIELFFRHFTNPEKRWINPGFCTGPYLPIYGLGLIVLYLIVSLESSFTISNQLLSNLLLIVLITISLTAIEYIAGIICLKVTKVRLWDYSNEFGNIQGIICPKFSLFWTLLGAIYCLFLHKHILNAVLWLSENLAFSFVVGMFYGFLIIDVTHSAQLIAKLKIFADENDIVIKFEMLKSYIQKKYEENKHRYHFFLPFRTEQPLLEYVKEIFELSEKRKK